MQSRVSKYRTHTCAELRIEHKQQNVTLSGWVQRKRDHGGVVFVDLRDHYGLTQVVFAGELKDRIQDTRIESVIQVTGEVRARDAEMINPKLETGEIEVHCTKLEVLTQAAVLPFQIAEDDKAPEANRLKYRFLELRRERLHKNIAMRSRVIHSIRQAMIDEGFLEYQTPILTSSSPEGARDYLVPSRLHPGKFFALPQAPQQFKQLIMVAGFDRYFQIAPCFRDEDPRADRSPGEFYQLDMEMSFVEQDNVLGVNERVMNRVFTEYSGGKSVTPTPFPRMSYDESMRRYGTDKPDLRIPLEIEDVSEIFAKSEFRVFQQAVENGGAVFAIKLPVDEIPPRKYFDDSIELFKKMSGQGLAYLSFAPDAEVKGVIKKFLSDSELEQIKQCLNLQTLHTVFFAAGKPEEILPHLGRLRLKLGEDFKRIDDTAYNFCWITDFPLFEWNEQEKKIDFGHNPFSMPRGGMQALLNEDPLKIYSSQYDLVCNGYELGSGAIRNHLPDVMYKAFEIAGYSNEVVDQKFSGMRQAFEYGPPPHGGFAHGVDRIVMLLAGEQSIREVIMFPLAQSGEDLMMKAPSEVSAQQLKDVHIQLDLPPELEAEG